MRKFLLTLMASLASVSAASAFWPEAADSSLDIGVGYRVDSLSWKTKADPNSSASGSGSSYSGSSSSSYSDYSSYSEYSDYSDVATSHVKWDDLKIWQIQFGGKYVTCDNVYLKAYADYGWVTSGHNKDRDFISNAEVTGEELSSSRSKTKGNVYDVDLAVGYRFKLCDDSFSLVPLVGYAWKGQHLRDRDLDDSYSDPTQTVVTEQTTQVVRSQSSSSYSSGYSSYSSGSGEHSKYHARWDGPFVGLDFDYRFMCDWALFGSYYYQWGRYHATGHWMLREGPEGSLPDGFRHTAKNVQGNRFDIGLAWDFCDCWTLSLEGKFEYFTAKHGRDRFNAASASEGNISVKEAISIGLKDVKWHSQAILFNVGAVY